MVREIYYLPFVIVHWLFKVRYYVPPEASEIFKLTRKTKIPCLSRKSNWMAIRDLNL